MSDTVEQVEKNVKDAMQSGQDVYNKVKTITLKALTERQLDRENIADVVRAVGKGIGGSLDSQYEVSKEVLQQSTSALDDALSSTAEATKLAVEEAAGKMQDFSDGDLQHAINDLNSLETMFLDALKQLSTTSKGAISETVSDLLKHAQTNGTVVGKQVQVMVDGIATLSVNSTGALLSSARETAANLASIGSGILAGIAESLQSDKTK
jgi:uncharacterized protein DUF6781